MVTKKSFYDLLTKETTELPKDKRHLLYFLDKTVLEQWLIREYKTKESLLTKIFMDLLYYVRGKYCSSLNVIIPVDVLIEMKKEGNEDVQKKKFKRWMPSLAKILEVNPDVEYSHDESVIKLAQEFRKAEYNCCILTFEPELYKKIVNDNIKVGSPIDLIFAIILNYSIIPPVYKKIIDEWLTE